MLFSFSEDDECWKNKSYGSVETSVSLSSSESSSAPASPSSSLLRKYSYVPPIANGTESSSRADKNEDFKDFPLNVSSSKTAESLIVNDICQTEPCSSPTPSKEGFNARKKLSSKRCGTCDGCTADFCGTCLFCTNPRSSAKFRCIQRRCKNKIVTERCRKCQGCLADFCGQCQYCLNQNPNFKNLCLKRRCTNKIVKKSASSKMSVSLEQSSSDAKEQETSRLSTKIGKSCKVKKLKAKTTRCGNCCGCTADFCGQCKFCLNTNNLFSKNLCLKRRCTNRIAKQDLSKDREKSTYSRNGKVPKNLHLLTKMCKENMEQSGKDNSNPKRFARCMKCEGCTSPACGRCSSCKIYSQFKDKIRDPVTCEQIVCKFPISLFGTHSQKTDKSLRHEDGCCPLKVINGSVYDFRCYFCKVLPRVGSANRSELYRHYSKVHYSHELKAEFGNAGHSYTCVYCKKFVKGCFISHIGQTHNEVEKYLPEAARIPSSVQGHGRGVRQMRRKHVAFPVTSKCEGWIFPEIPDGYDPNGNTREIHPPEEKIPFVVIDGFMISNEVDEDEEPIFCSREEPQEMPDYSGKCGRCELCHSTFPMIEDAVRHIQKNHGIMGSQHLMLFAARLLKGGYISIPNEIVEKDIIFPK